jgi:hypothetical protein
VKAQELRGFFCGFELHRQSTDHALEFDEPGLFSGGLAFLCEDEVGMREQLFFPGGEQLFTELMLTTDLSCGLRPGEDLEDDTGLEFRFESSMFCHQWIPLSGLYSVDQKLSSFWVLTQFW